MADARTENKARCNKCMGMEGMLEASDGQLACNDISLGLDLLTYSPRSDRCWGSWCLGVRISSWGASLLRICLQAKAIKAGSTNI
eukprot:1155150-Pelagomonas_calceolata.AAC.8